MWIKICGVTREVDVSTVVRAGADAIGFNFFHGSKRSVSNARANDLIQMTKRNPGNAAPLDLVGVFVNSDAQTIKSAVEETGINVIQIHGDETVEQIAEIHRLCPDIPLIRALRLHSENAERQLEEIDNMLASIPFAAILLDTFVPGEFGGTGKTLDGRILQRYMSKSRPRLILAGGLTPENVTSVQSHPVVWGIDTASGVESSPGAKDAVRVFNFIKNARQANSVDRHVCRIGSPS